MVDAIWTEKTLDPLPQLQAGLLAHQSGDLETAQHHYVAILRHNSRQPDALNLLGVAHCQQGELSSGVELIRHAIASNPRVPDYHLNLGNALLQRGDAEAAIAAYSEAARRNPALPEATLGLAEAQLRLGHWDRVVAALRQTLAIAPQHRLAALRLGEALIGQGEVEAGLAHFESLAAAHPGDAEVQQGLGMALAGAQRHEAARERLLQALRLNPDLPHAWLHLGNVHYELNDPEAAADAFLKAIALRPDFASAYANLAKVLSDADRLPESLAASEQALRHDPDFDAAWSLRGATLMRSGDATGSAACYQRALQLRPSAELSGKYASTLSYTEAHAPERIHAAHLDFGRQFDDQKFVAWDEMRFANEPRHRLRLGYVSPDLNQHAVAYFLAPLLRAHDRSGFEIFAYHTSARSDAMTEQLRGLCDAWVDASALDDAALADRIRADRVDILIDLAGHTTGHRLPVFAQKPAPLQMTWLGYLTTTGLKAIDYRITDASVDPEGYEAWQVERPLRLPGCYLCYEPPADAPAVAPLPARVAGRVTFGSFNNLAKLGPATVALWSRVLLALPDARLLLKNKALGEEWMRERVLENFAAQGIDSERLILAGWQAAAQDHLAAYAQVDIALDPLPYNGVTTTCEALWMGVPVLSLVGNTHAARQGLSLLGALGLDELACPDEESFVAKARALASDLPALEALRAGLRQRMSDSPLTDAAGVARNQEQAYRLAWRECCGHASTSA